MSIYKYVNVCFFTCVLEGSGTVNPSQHGGVPWTFVVSSRRLNGWSGDISRVDAIEPRWRILSSMVHCTAAGALNSCWIPLIFYFLFFFSHSRDGLHINFGVVLESGSLVDKSLRLQYIVTEIGFHDVWRRIMKSKMLSMGRHNKSNVCRFRKTYRQSSVGSNCSGKAIWVN